MKVYIISEKVKLTLSNPSTSFFQGDWEEERGNVDSREALAQYASGVRPFFAKIMELEAERLVDNVVVMDRLEQVREK